MIEYILLFALGAIVASLAWLLVLPAVTRRAARLAAARLEDQIPRSLEEIEGERDALRAEFAVQIRRLEIAAEKQKERLNETLQELGRRGEATRQAEFIVGQRDQLVAEGRQREAQLQQALDSTREQLGRTMQALAESQKTVAEREAALGLVQKALGEKTAFVDGQRIELATLKTQLEAGRIALGEAQAEIAARQKDSRTLGAARDEAAKLAQRLAADLERKDDLIKDLEGGLTPLAEARLGLVREIATLSDAVTGADVASPELAEQLSETAARLVAVAASAEPRGPLAAIIETTRLLHRGDPPGADRSLLTRIAEAADTLAPPAEKPTPVAPPARLTAAS